MTFAERREMWREKRRMQRFWRTRTALALLALLLSVVGWVTESFDLIVLTAALTFVGTVPFLVSDFRVDARWRASRAARGTPER